MARNHQPWSRADYDRLEALVNAGWRYPAIAAEMGREVTRVRAAAQRIGLTSREGQRWNERDDWAEIDRIIIDGIESSLMTIPQVSEHLRALGYAIHTGTVYRRVHGMHYGVMRRARSNSRRRRAACAARMRQRKQRAA